MKVATDVEKKRVLPWKSFHQNILYVKNYPHIYLNKFNFSSFIKPYNTYRKIKNLFRKIIDL